MMPATTPEAIARKRHRKNKRRRERRAQANPVVVPTINLSRRWHIGPKMPEMSKAELRAMFAEAMARTAAL